MSKNKKRWIIFQLIFLIIISYASVFCIAELRYKYIKSSNDKQTKNIYDNIYKGNIKLIADIGELQKKKVPEEPYFINPARVYRSLTVKGKPNKKNVEKLTGIVEKFKYKLKGIDLSGINLKKTNLSDVDFTGANFSNSVLIEVNFKNGNMKNAVFTETDGNKADFDSTFMENADFSRSNLTDALFHNAYLWGVNFQNTDLRRANFYHARLNEVNFTGADLREAKYLTYEKLCTVKSLYKATLDPKIEKRIKRECPGLLEAPSK